MGKKDRCAVFGCNNDRLFPEKCTMKFSFCPKSGKKVYSIICVWSLNLRMQPPCRQEAIGGGFAIRKQ